MTWTQTVQLVTRTIWLLNRLLFGLLLATYGVRAMLWIVTGKGF